MKKEMSCTQAIIVVLLLPIVITLNGFILTLLWSWFIVPQFSLPYLSIPMALGLATILSMLTHQTTDSSHNKDKTFTTICVEAFSRPLSNLLYGWVITLFM